MNGFLFTLRDRLVEAARARLGSPLKLVSFTGNPEADKLVNDLDGYPHAFVIACIMDRQIRAERAWLIPHNLRQRLGYFEFGRLVDATQQELAAAMTLPTPLHRMPNKMSVVLHLAIRNISCTYGGDAALIWSGRPSSATIVRRFLEFRDVGQKIATMAANILVREFHVPISDCYSIDISVDVQIRRVFSRLGFVPEDAQSEYIVYRARELHPEYPGIFDGILWETGRESCHPTGPDCAKCQYSDLCAYAKRASMK